MPIYFLLSIWVLLSVGREPTPQAYAERGALFYNALTTDPNWRGVLRRDRNSTVAPRTRSLHPDGSGRSLPASSFASSSFAFPLRTAFPRSCELYLKTASGSEFLVLSQAID